MASRLILTLLPLLLLGCRYFTLLEPEPPQSGQQEIFPDTPEKVFTNMKNALSLYYNTSLYSNCLSYDFTFYPDERLPYPSNQPWGKETEKSIISNLLLDLDYSTSHPAEVSFYILNLVNFPDSAFVRLRYTMSFAFRSFGNVSSEGEAEVHMRKRLDGRWVITTWKDNKDTSKTWGEVKLLFK